MANEDVDTLCNLNDTYEDGIACYTTCADAVKDAELLMFLHRMAHENATVVAELQTFVTNPGRGLPKRIGFFENRLEVADPGQR